MRQLSTNLFFYDANQDHGAINIENMTDEQINNLSQEELEAIQEDESTGDMKLPKSGKKPPEPPKDQDQPEPPEDKKEEDPPKEDTSDDETPPETDKEDTVKKDADRIAEIEAIPKEERTEAQTYELRHLHATRKMHEATQLQSKLARENEELKEKLYKIELEQEETFEYLEQEEYEQLPRAEQAEYDKEKNEYENRQQHKKVNQDAQTMTNIATFYKSVTGAEEDLENLLQIETVPGDQDGKTQFKNPAFREFLASDEFLKISDKVKTWPKTRGVYTAEQMLEAHFLLNKDKLLSDASIKGRSEAVEDITKATHSDASKLGEIPHAPGRKGVKRLSDYTEDEIDNMSQAQLNQLEQQMRESG